MPERIVVGMSGGVDSSVAAWRLREAGFDVHGLFMFNWAEDEDGYCTAAEDYVDARRVCDDLDIPLHKADFSAAYRERVFDDFLAEYRRGRTPNPDVLCNREIKFGVFLDYARRLGASRIATGHYARVDRRDGRWRLLKGNDAKKDQSYFLHALDQAQLGASLFPLGELDKSAVRAAALELGFDNARKKDSTGICFIGERPMREFLKRYLPASPGVIRTPAGVAVGEHVGLMYYTYGQRQGLNIGGVQGAADAPWYVVDKLDDSNTLIVDQGHDNPRLFSDALEADGCHWIAGDPPAASFDCHAKTRYRQPDQPCSVEVTSDGSLRVRFASPQRAVTPGQFVVLYDGAVCLGGGVIASRKRLAPGTAGDSV
ncbi:MAG: tRNA 2-thiouridine(34) synthase MnmA [Pseudomonadota bacterium]